MKNFRLKKTVLATAMACGIMLSVPANSSVGTELTNFYNSMGGMAAATPPSVAEGQSAYYLTLGNMKARTPMKNFTMGSIALPKVSAGCGGIDIYGGSFSLINVDEFVQMMKNIGSNAIGFAFQLALDVISPQIAGELKDLRSYIDKFNQFSQNSCEAAQALVGGAMKFTGLQKSYCQQATLNYSQVPDGAAARKVCATDSGSESLYQSARTKANAGDKESKDWVDTFSGNLMWEGLKRRGFDPVKNESDRDLMQLMISFTGTVIIPGPDDIDPATGARKPFQFKVGSVKFSDLVYEDYASTTGQSPDLLKCAGAEYDRCIDMVSASEADLKILRTTIKGLVNSIAGKIGGGPGALTAQELNLIGMSDVPIYGLMQAAADVSPSALQSVVETYTDYATAEVAYSFINDAMANARAAILAAPTASADTEKKLFMDNLEHVLAYAYQDVRKERNRMGGTFAVMKQIDELRVRAMNRYAPDMQRRIALARALRTPR